MATKKATAKKQRGTGNPASDSTNLDSMIQFMKRSREDATTSMVFGITPKHVREAVRRCPTKCVVARAITETFSTLGLPFEGIQVGPRITKVYVPGREIRYATSGVLQDAIRVFDETGKWGLPSGEYTLLPVPATMRLGFKPTKKSKRSKYYLNPKRGRGHQIRFAVTRGVLRSGLNPVKLLPKRKKAA